MEKFLILSTFLLFALTSSVYCQKAEVLYFKADLTCCQARACNSLEADVKSTIQKLYPNGEVAFKTIRLADPANKSLIEKFNAKSQTVVIVAKNKKGEKTLDISEIVRNYNSSKDMVVFESALKNKFNEIFK